MIYDTINIMLPTYKRVKNGRLQPFIESTLAMVSDPKNIIFTFLINDEDLESKEYLINYPNQDKFFDWEILYEQEPTPNLAIFFNILFKKTRNKDPGTLVSMVGDDMRWMTKDFDLKILNAINYLNGEALVYCNDGYIQGPALCVNLFISRKLADSASVDGYWMPNDFPVDYIDNVWMEFAKMNNLLCYLDDVMLKHEHSTKVGFDDTYNRLRSNYYITAKNLGSLELYIDTMDRNYKKSKL